MNSPVIEAAVVDSSPLILLSKSSLLHFLRLAGDPVVVPRPVIDEIAVAAHEAQTIRSVRAAGWIEIVEAPAIPEDVAACDLGRGETAVLAWASAHPGSQAILDDSRARRCALQLGIAVGGTVKLVLAAKRAGMIPLARPVVDQLREAGLYIADRLMNEALAVVGE